jgi:hypothetical protein
MPSSKNYVRDYVQERLTESPARKKARLMRDKARRYEMKQGKVHVGDGKDVGHILNIGRGGKTTPSNLEVQSAHANRSFKRNSKGKLVSETSDKERKKK